MCQTSSSSNSHAAWSGVCVCVPPPRFNGARVPVQSLGCTQRAPPVDSRHLRSRNYFAKKPNKRCQNSLSTSAAHAEARRPIPKWWIGSSRSLRWNACDPEESSTLSHTRIEGCIQHAVSHARWRRHPACFLARRVADCYGSQGQGAEVAENQLTNSRSF